MDSMPQLLSRMGRCRQGVGISKEKLRAAKCLGGQGSCWLSPCPVTSPRGLTRWLV